MDRVSHTVESYRKKKTPEFRVGDTVDVHVRIQEGEKERIQLFTGVVLCRKNSGISETFTVRRIVQGEGVERIFPLHSPFVADVKVKKRSIVHRSKLYYLRNRQGKSARMKERIDTREEVVPGESVPAAVPAPAAANA
jgi:large subunit ribosomal protein L19